MPKALEDSPIVLSSILKPAYINSLSVKFKPVLTPLIIGFAFLLASQCVAQVPTRSYSDIRQVDFRNFTYRVTGFLERPSDIRLRDGMYVEKDRGLVTYSVKLTTVAYGDVTGDGEEDAAIVLTVSGGGSGFVTEGVVYTLRNGRAALLSNFEGGEGGHADSIQNVHMANGRLGVVYVNRAGNTHSVDYRWDGQRFVPTRGGEQTRTSVVNDRYFVRLSNCDDSCIARINDQDIGTTGFGQDSGWIELDRKIQPGVNRIRFLVFNSRGAIAYAFQVRKNDTVVFEKVCGQAGRYGCENERVFPNNSLARTFTYELVWTPQGDNSTRPITSNKPLIGSVSKSHVADGCGCWYQPTNDSSRTIFSSDFETIWMNIDGEDVKLNLVSSTLSSKVAVRKGQRNISIYNAPGITVRIESVVTKTASDNYEGSDYAGTITVNKAGGQQTVSFTGFCGC